MVVGGPRIPKACTTLHLPLYCTVGINDVDAPAHIQFGPNACYLRDFSTYLGRYLGNESDWLVNQSMH